MYDPIKDGMKKNSAVSYREAKPPQALSGVVHSYWQIKTEASLTDDFILHAIPDACVNILFNQKDTEIAGITALQTSYTELNLGRDFNYAGIQLFPGVWKGNQSESKDGYVGSKYLGDLPLLKVNAKTAALSFSDKQLVFTDLMLKLMELQVVEPNEITKKILTNLEQIHNVSEMAVIAGLSSRQLQRILKKTTGFSPHNFLKVMRFQQTLKHHHLDLYADQSHFIHSFKKITGYTPTEYFQTYDV
jgi:AraC-like DNA-binding protein